MHIDSLFVSSIRKLAPLQGLPQNNLMPAEGSLAMFLEDWHATTCPHVEAPIAFWGCTKFYETCMQGYQFSLYPYTLQMHSDCRQISYIHKLYLVICQSSLFWQREKLRIQLSKVFFRRCPST